MADFRQWAPHAPMGWNSWDCFGASVTEAEVRANADYMAAHLRPFGYNYVVVDIQWSEPNADGWAYHPFTALTMDDQCRLIPAPNRFPSATTGGFTALAAYVHGLGLKFGIHMMRGIPRQAVHRDLTFGNGRYRARDVAANNICRWNSDMYGLDMTQPGAQAYYDSVIALYASWGVDFIKCDDIADSTLYGMLKPEIMALRAAIDKTGRPMVLSLSPGPADINEGAFLQQNANMWRLTDDFWDTWPQLAGMFPVAAKWAPFVRPGSWPDPDMLPLGAILQRQGGPRSRFTTAEAQTMLTLWSLLQAPLFLGGDLTHSGPEEALYTNPKLLAMRQDLKGAWQQSADAARVTWQGQGTAKAYTAVFNLLDVAVPLPAAIGEPLWAGDAIAPHGVAAWATPRS
ncbi:glycoside hydrolase family 27 protein [Lacticaseibacillus parakribbianus]|uniref:glycoside hydrolase family 27 protein n=1 Tax=Lacticaseibacillus parakribbianus TaxID=2970927 RepID=UPI0021CB4C9A|nr:glycoside hydrolase family 27 protein [Lacticaseibacillus parakribbianus]